MLFLESKKEEKVQSDFFPPLLQHLSDMINDNIHPSEHWRFI